MLFVIKNVTIAIHLIMHLASLVALHLYNNTTTQYALSIIIRVFLELRLFMFDMVLRRHKTTRHLVEGLFYIF